MLTFIVAAALCISFPVLIPAVIGYWIGGVALGVVLLIVGLAVTGQ